MSIRSIPTALLFRPNKWPQREIDDVEGLSRDMTGDQLVRSIDVRRHVDGYIYSFILVKHDCFTTANLVSAHAHATLKT